MVCLAGTGTAHAALADLGPACVLTDSDPDDPVRRAVDATGVPVLDLASIPGATDTTVSPSLRTRPPTWRTRPAPTGRPKGIRQTHAALAQFTGWFAAEFGIGAGTRLAQWAAPGYDACLVEVFAALRGGATLCPVPWRIRADPDRLVPWLSRERVTVLQTVPSFARELEPLARRRSGVDPAGRPAARRRGAAWPARPPAPGAAAADQAGQPVRTDRDHSRHLARGVRRGHRARHRRDRPAHPRTRPARARRPRRPLPAGRDRSPGDPSGTSPPGTWGRRPRTPGCSTRRPASTVSPRTTGPVTSAGGARTVCWYLTAAGICRSRCTASASSSPTSRPPAADEAVAACAVVPVTGYDGLVCSPPRRLRRTRPRRDPGPLALGTAPPVRRSRPAGHLTTVDSLPRNTGGKVDRRALAGLRTGRTKHRDPMECAL